MGKKGLRWQDIAGGVFSQCKFNNLLLAHTYTLGYVAWSTCREKALKHSSKI